MTLNTTESRKSFAGNDVTVAFAYPFKFIEDADLVVILKDSSDVETEQVLTTNYTVSGAGSETGGTVTMIVAPATGEDLTIYRDPAITQGVDFVENDSDPAEVKEGAHDKAAMIDQRLGDRMDRSVALSDGFTDTFDTELPAGIATAEVALATNAAGDGFAVGPTITDIANAATNATAAASSATASASSATASASSATASATSETNAAASETAAALAAASVLWNDVSFKAFSDSPIAIVDGDSGTLFAVDCTAGNVVVNLPAISALTLSPPWSIGFKKTDTGSNTITINRNGSDTIDGGTSIVVSRPEAGVVLIPDVDPSPDEWTSQSFGEVPIEGAIVGDTDNQTVTNKTFPAPIITDANYTGGVSSDTKVLVLPINNTAALDALTAKAGRLDYDSTIKKPRYHDGNKFRTLGGGAGRVNFLEDDDTNFEGGTGKYETFDDGAVTTPVDGKYGSASAVSFAQDTSIPLDGEAHLKFSKGASSGQGEGVSIPVKMRNVDQQQITEISFDIQTDLIYTDGELEVYIVNPVTQKIIQPTPHTIKATQGKNARFKALFQAEDSHKFGIGTVILTATFEDVGDLDFYETGSVTATLANGTNISGGKLNVDVNSGSPSFWFIPDAGASKNMVQTGCIRIKVEPNYTGSPALAQEFIRIGGSGAQNRARIFHFTDGLMKIEIKDPSGVDIVSSAMGAYVAAAGVAVEWELNWDITSGATRLFKDGVQQGSTLSDTGVRDSTSTNQGPLIGDVVTDQDTKIHELAMWDAVQHTSAYTAGAIIPNSYLNPAHLRLLFFVPGTGTNAWNVDIDNVLVGPPQYNFGAPVTEWGSVPWTPTGTWTSGGAYAGSWRRVGDTLHGWARFNATGAVTAATLSINMPPGLVIDTAKRTLVAGLTVIGQSMLRDNNTGVLHSGRCVFVDSTTIRPVVFSDSATFENTANITNNNIITIANLDTVEIEFSIPIVGWSTNVQMSDDADTRVLAARYESSNSQAVTGGAAINFTTKDYDTHGAYSAGVLTCPFSGIYDVTTHFETTANMGGGIDVQLFKNGSLHSVLGNDLESAGVNNQFWGTGQVECNAGDTLDVRMVGNSGTLTAIAADNWVSFSRRSGPSAIAASEVVIMRASGNPASAAAGAPVIWPTRDFDSHGTYNIATGLYECPSAGKYRVSGYVTSGNATITLNIAVDEVTDIAGGITDGNGEGVFNGVVECLAGQTISLEPSGTLDVASGHMSIERIGGIG